MLGLDSGIPDAIVYRELRTEPVRVNRLTQTQYRNAIVDLLGREVTVSGSLEPDVEAEGLLSTGSVRGGVSARGVELYQAGAQSIGEQFVASEVLIEQWVGCEPEIDPEDPCVGAFVENFGRQVWRRQLSDDERRQIMGLWSSAALVLEDGTAALSYVVSFLLQSPHFLYRFERGMGDGASRRYTSVEMASRLSFFIWNGPPDAELLDVAQADGLLDDDVLAIQIERMLLDDKARRGLRNFFTEWLQLYKLDDMRKDPNIFRHYSADLGDMAREESLLLVDALFVDGDEGLEQLFTSRRAFVNRRLAAIYDVPATAVEGYGEVEFDDGRQGFLGQVSFLGLHAHAVSTSATLRGLFLREALMCQPAPPPPAGVDTSIPEASADAPTLRERLVTHLESPSCNGCHTLTDLPGLGFENFDGIGRFRRTENGAIIDPSGSLDGIEFSGFPELANAIGQSRVVSDCVVRRMLDYALGRVTGNGYDGARAQLADEFVAGGRSIRSLVTSIALSEGFRRAGEVE